MSDAMIIPEMVKAGGGLFTDILNSGIAAANFFTNESWRKKYWAEQLRLNEQAQANYREQMDFQKSVWNETKEREDNAISRRVKDMQSVGLNPVAATGASSSSVSTVAQPHLSVSEPGQVNMKQMNFDNAIAMAQLSMQKKLNDANVANINADTSKKQQDTEQSYWKTLEIQENTNYLKSRTNLTDKEVEKTAQEMANLSAQLTKINAEIGNINKDTSLKQSYIDLNTQKTFEVIEETRNLIAQNSVIRKTADKLDAEIAKLKGETLSIYAKKLETDLYNEILLQYPKEYREKILSDWKQSGLTVDKMYADETAKGLGLAFNLISVLLAVAKYMPK